MNLLATVAAMHAQLALSPEIESDIIARRHCRLTAVSSCSLLRACQDMPLPVAADAHLDAGETLRVSRLASGGVAVWQQAKQLISKQELMVGKELLQAADTSRRALSARAPVPTSQRA